MTSATTCTGCGRSRREILWSEQFDAELCVDCLEGRAESNGGGKLNSRDQDSYGDGQQSTTATVSPSEVDSQSTPHSTWAPVPLGPVLDGDAATAPPLMLSRTDSQFLIYPGKIHAIQGEPEAGKGWLALRATAERLQAGEHVLYLDFEDEVATAVERLLALEADRSRLEACFHYVRPDEPLDSASWSDLKAALAGPPTLCIVDGVTEALSLQGLSVNDNDDVATFMKLLPRRLQRTGAAVVLIDHVQKSRESRGRYAIGAQHKLAGADVAYSLEAREPFGRGVDGHAVIKVRKDRPGHVRRHAIDDRIALMQVRSLDDGDRLRVELEPPGDVNGDFRPTSLMEKISETVEQKPALSKTDIRTSVTGKNGAKDEALKLLVSEGYIQVKKDGPTHRHHSIRRYRPADDPEDRGTTR